MYRYNLIIMHVPGHQHIGDFLAIRNMMAGRAPDIEVGIVTFGAKLAPDFWKIAAGRPTFIFSPMPQRLPEDIRGTRCIPELQSKFDEVRQLHASGLPVPRTTLLRPGVALDPEKWGPFAVVKPNFGFRGQGIRLRRTRYVRWIDPQAWPADDPHHGKALVAQQFVSTGLRPSSYRVMTVLGRAVYCITSTASDPQPELDPHGADDFDVAIAPNGMSRSLALANDAKVVALAERVHGSITRLPVLGVDIIRDAKSGQLYVLEMNASGWTWHLSSRHGLHHQRESKLDLYGQFNALGIITGALIDATHRLAS